MQTSAIETLDKPLLIEHSVGNEIVPQRPRDGYINATLLCKQVGKLFGHYNESTQTKAFLEELSADIGIPISALVQIVRGGNDKLNQGTWVHPQVAIHLGQWLSPQFAVQVSKWVLDWMTGTIPPSELQSIHDRMLLASPHAWTKTFPDELFDEIYRLHPEWGEYDRETHRTISEVGNIINDIVYERVGPGMRAALDNLNPPRPHKGKQFKNHQFMTPDDGKRLLKMHLHSLIFLMRTYDDGDWSGFMQGLDQTCPRYDKNLRLPIGSIRN